jgi:hypothetical protein
MHPLPPELWCEPPMAEFERLADREAVTTSEPAETIEQ